MFYYNDFLQSEDKEQFIQNAIEAWKVTSIYKTALIAKQYDENNNVTIKTFQKFITDTCGNRFPDLISANNKIATAKFNELLTQTTQYSLANGINYAEGIDIDEQLGRQIDSETAVATRLAMRDGQVFVYYDGVNTIPFTVLEFVPLYDENTGALMAGIRFFQIEKDKPLNVLFYETDGVTQYRSTGKNINLIEINKKQTYALEINSTKSRGVISAESISMNKLPIVELKGNMYGISFLNFVRDKIDSLDLTISGLANDLDMNEFVFWIVKNSGGMDAADLSRFRQHLKTTGIASIDSEDGGGVEHFTKDVPVEARTRYIEIMLDQIYSAWGAFDLSKLSNGAVNMLQINALFAVADNRASELELEIKKYIIQILALKGIEIFDWQISFVRNKLVSAQQTAIDDQMNTNTVMNVSSELDDRTILETLKNKTTLFADIDVEEILKEKSLESISLVNNETEAPSIGQDTEQPEEKIVEKDVQQPEE